MLFEDLQKDNITALKNHDKIARSILSIVYGKCKNESIEQGLNAKSLSDEDTLRIIQKTIKELEEEKKSFLIAKREEKVDELEAQIKVIEKYLPKQLSEAEIKDIISNLEDKKIPSIMKFFKANYSGKCDMGLVSKIAKEFQ